MEEQNIAILAEHYQKSFEVAYEMWKQRNRLFLWLLGLVSVAVLLTFQAPQANPLLVNWIAKLVGVTEAVEIEEIEKGFPFALLHSALGFAIFYAMVNVYQHSRIIRQSNSYLPRLEIELRKELGLRKESVFFTRESGYNTGERFKDGAFIAWTYIISLGLLLLAFIGGRVMEDLQLRNPLLMFIDAILILLIGIYFILYARGSVGRGKRKTKTFEDYQAEIHSILGFAQQKRLSEITIKAGELYTLVEGRPLEGLPEQEEKLQISCTALTSSKQEGDEVIGDLHPGGYADWTIKYRFPRKSPQEPTLSALLSVADSVLKGELRL
jgi:hypothetical protein